MIKIALSGKAKTGKNTASNLLADIICDPEYNYRSVIRLSSFNDRKMMAFADPMKEALLLMFPWANKECLYGASELRQEIIPNAIDTNGQPLTYRQALIDLGTLYRTYNPMHWISVFDHRLKHNLIKSYDLGGGITTITPKVAICTDARFQNELDYLKAEKFFLVRVKRKTDIHINHSTETGQDLIPDSAFDYVIDNNGTLEDLERQVQEIIARVS